MNAVDKAKLIADFHQRMAEVRDDKERAHVRADAFLLKMLGLLGHGDVVAAWQEEQIAAEGWWYG
jgi:hypothetical protein